MTDDEELFIVRIWRVNAASPPEDTRWPRLGPAIDNARMMAYDPTIRSAQVLDDHSMEWAKFNMLWNIPEEYR